MEIQTPYALTVCFKDRYQFFGKIDRYEKCNEIIADLCYSFPGNISLQPEYSTLLDTRTKITKGPRIHYHGIISFNNTKELNLWLLTKHHNFLLYGTCDIETIKDIDSYRDYCLKQSHLHNLTSQLGNISLEDITSLPPS